MNDAEETKADLEAIESMGRHRPQEPTHKAATTFTAEKGDFLSDSFVGTEFEITRNLFGDDYGWEWNPTIFFGFSF